MSSYNPNIPQPNNVLSISQSQLLANFGQLNTQFSVDHSPFWTGSSNGTGHHNQVTFDQAASVPSPSGTQSVIYPTVPAGYSTQEVMFANATESVQMTDSTLNASSGEGFIPGGLQVRCGSGSSNGSGITNNFSTAFPNACISVTATGRNTALTGNILKIMGFTTTGVTVQSPMGEAIYYISIGY